MVSGTNRSRVLQQLIPPHRFAPLGQFAALLIVQTELFTPLIKLLPEHAILFLEIIDHLLLFSIHLSRRSFSEDGSNRLKLLNISGLGYSSRQILKIEKRPSRRISTELIV